jgi:hypothetical protein
LSTVNSGGAARALFEQTNARGRAPRAISQPCPRIR